ncbi:DUF4197 domain-containing protein [Sphingomonas lacunae]|uniref:DUF4197 domain-containing protein n=1 Tax=Sphingomonas lacunae TaxID=2698828 RepID=A0A6M4ATN4_9SPHN|nr:DUF4197 domain-containing protein [Sphingomonas lacunae]QJQ32425.1 DUF4197 domain-containing protein [Sphingomonas lacunae]
MTDISLQSGVNRRSLIRIGALAPLLTMPLLAGCATGPGGFNLTEAIRRLLTLSSQRAFALLLQPNGFYDSQVARIELPQQLASSGGVLRQVLTTQVVRDRLARSLNSAAERGAERAAPVITQAISSITVADAMSVLRGGPGAATALLEQSLAGGLINQMFPAVGDALRIASDDVVARALRAATGYDVASLARDVSDGANRGIWRAIAAEEANIRANPQATNDPLLIAVLALAR